MVLEQVAIHMKKQWTSTLTSHHTHKVTQKRIIDLSAKAKPIDIKLLEKQNQTTTTKEEIFTTSGRQRFPE